MSDIDIGNIRKLDMTLLLIFQELMRHRKLTAAARNLGFTQSAISHRLRRLRDVFDDELFIRRPTGVEPTQRAIDLEPQIRAMLDLAHEAISGRTLVLGDAHGVIRIAAPDYHSTLLAAPLIEKIGLTAPKLQVSFRPLVRQAALEALDANEANIALGFFRKPPDRFRSRVLFKDDYAVVARENHPLLKKKLTLKQYLDAQHIVVSLDGTVSGIVDVILARQGHSRRLVAAVPFFFTALATVARSDLIATIPSRLANAFAGRLGLRLYPPPIEIRPYTVSAVWHERNANSALHLWIVEQIQGYDGGER
jgi:DNA-binding transcriptional LysR family regulator